ncbi:MAG TPA: ECF transporter S component [Candidatus Bathyarchaeia archaeon]|nr:ECF transporter S component [Candidatus Bathyarchaeia archaeon]
MESEPQKSTPTTKTNRRATVVTLTLSATFIALVFVATFPFSSLFPVPSTQGYYDPGDIMIFVAALTFGPVVGGISGAVGSALSDALGGFGTFAPFTFVIKGLEGYLVGIAVLRGVSRKALLLAWVIGGLILVGGYFLSETYFIAWIFGASPYTGLAAALGELPINILQAVGAGLVGIPASSILRSALQSSAYYPRLGGAVKGSAPKKKLT